MRDPDDFGFALTIERRALLTGVAAAAITQLAPSEAKCASAEHHAYTVEFESRAGTVRKVYLGDPHRLRQIMFDHPSTCPNVLRGPPRLIENPSECSPTWRLERFRDFVRTRAAEEPDDPDWPAFFACTEAALAYRATVPPEYQFWYDYPPPA